MDDDSDSKGKKNEKADPRDFSGSMHTDGNDLATRLKEFVLRVSKEACDNGFPIALFATAGPDHTFFVEHALCKNVNGRDAAVVTALSMVIRKHVEGPWLARAFEIAEELTRQKKFQEIRERVQRGEPAWTSTNLVVDANAPEDPTDEN